MDETFSPIVRLVSVTPDAEKSILEMARVSSADPTSGKTGLLKYLQRNGHWSPFEMASMVIEVHCTRDIARQLLRHRSFSFQEFSQRYQDVTLLQDGPALRAARMQDPNNRQNSFDCSDPVTNSLWTGLQRQVWDLAKQSYDEALAMGVAKEQARALLPEGMTITKLYMSGTFRSWIHYVEARCAPGTQREHAEIALLVKGILQQQLPHLDMN